MSFKKTDFIELEFTGRLKNGEIFDSNIKEDLEKLHHGHDHPIETKPFVLCFGEHMFLDSLEDFLMEKDVGEYEISLSPEKAFGVRNSKMIMKIPMKIFIEQKINPVQGEVFNFDGRLAKILTVSGGRVMADFNNPLAGKDVVYKLKVKRKVDDVNEKIKAMINFLFRRDLNFQTKDKKIIVEIEPQLSQFVEIFKDKFKSLFDMDIEAKEIKKEENPKKDLNAENK